MFCMVLSSAWTASRFFLFGSSTLLVIKLCIDQKLGGDTVVTAPIDPGYIPWCEGYTILYEQTVLSSKSSGKRKGINNNICFSITHAEALLSRIWLDSWPLIGSSERICYLIFFTCTAFVSPIKPSLSQWMKFPALLLFSVFHGIVSKQTDCWPVLTKNIFIYLRVGLLLNAKKSTIYVPFDLKIRDSIRNGRN